MLSKSIKAVKMLLLAIFALAAVLPALQVEAASPPLPPGCYWRQGAGDFEPINCPTEGLARGASGPNGACYLTRTQNGTVFFSVRCSNFALIENETRNRQEAQRVCGAVDSNSYWSSGSNRCYWGDNCQTGGPNTGDGCDVMTVQQTYEGYVRGELPLPGYTPPSSGGGGGSTGSGSTGGGSTSGGGSTTATPGEDLTGTAAAPGDTSQEDAALGQPQTVENDCNGPNIQAGLAEGDPNHCGILDYLVIFINVLSAVAGVVIIGSIVGGGIQYSAAGSDPAKVSAAKARIRNAIIALLFFLFGYGLLNWLVPGGVL